MRTKAESLFEVFKLKEVPHLLCVYMLRYLKDFVADSKSDQL